MGSARRNAQAEGEESRRGKRTELDRILGRHSAIGELGREFGELEHNLARRAQLKLGRRIASRIPPGLVWFRGSAVLFCFGVSGWCGGSSLFWWLLFPQLGLSIGAPT